MEVLFCLAGSPGWRVASLGELGGGYKPVFAKRSQNANVSSRFWPFLGVSQNGLDGLNPS